MKRFGFVALLSGFFSCGVLAAVDNPNPNVSISIIGNDTVAIPNPYVVLPADFAVRVVDARGKPIAGLTVKFAPQILCDIMFDDQCAIEINELAGYFKNGSTAELVTTDDQGIAAAGPFVDAGFPGTYNVAAILSSSFSSQNASVLAGRGDPIAYFQVWQDFAASSIAIQPALTGAWTDRYLSGQAFEIEVLANNTVLVMFLTFDPAGNNVWLIGVGSQTNLDRDTGFADVPMYTTSGGKFPPYYDPGAINKTPWGTLRLHFTDCNSGDAAWTVEGGTAQGYTDGKVPIFRVTSIPGLTCS